MLWGVAGLLIGQWQAGGGILNARCEVTWQRGGQWQTGGILDAWRWVTWLSGGCKGIALADWGRCPRCSMSSDVAERRAVADRGRPRHSTSGDVAKWRVRGWWQTRGGILDAQCGREEGCGRPGASSMLNVGWRGRAEGARAMANQGRHPWCSMSSDVAERRVEADQKRHSQCLTLSNVAGQRVRAVAGGTSVHVVWKAHGWWRWETKVGGWT